MSVASTWHCGLHRLEPLFHQTHAGAYVHISKEWPFVGQTLSVLASAKRLKTLFLPKSAKKSSFLVKN